jgi:hypothetical protein
VAKNARCEAPKHLPKMYLYSSDKKIKKNVINAFSLRRLIFVQSSRFSVLWAEHCCYIVSYSCFVFGTSWVRFSTLWASIVSDFFCFLNFFGK